MGMCGITNLLRTLVMVSDNKTWCGQNRTTGVAAHLQPTDHCSIFKAAPDDALEWHREPICPHNNPCQPKPLVNCFGGDCDPFPRCPVVMQLFLSFFMARFQLDSQVCTGLVSSPFKGVWHKCRFLNCPWVDTRPAKYLGAHTSLIGEYLLKPLEIRKNPRKRCGSNPRPPGSSGGGGGGGDTRNYLYMDS